MPNKQGWLIHKGVYSDHSCKWNMVSRQRDALERIGVDFAFMDVVEASFRLAKVFTGEEEAPAWALFRNPDMDMRHALETIGVPCVNSFETAAICRDKYLTAAFCNKHGIPHPLTMKVPAIDMSEEQRERFIDAVEANIGYPMVIKGAYGSAGMGVKLISNREELDFALPHSNRDRIIQKLVEASWGRDARLFVIDGKIVFAHERINTDGDFRSNVAQGGQSVLHDPTDAECRLAERIGALLPRSAISVDIIWDGKGEPILCELNGNPDFSDLNDKTMSNPVFENAIANMIMQIARERS